MLPRIFIVYDTEGTGLDLMRSEDLNIPCAISRRGDEVCQIGGIILDNGMIPQKLFCHYCDTIQADSPYSALQVHGISQREVRRYLLGQFLPEIMQKYLKEFFYENVVFICYNTKYDMSMVSQCLANSPLNFTWEYNTSPVLPNTGRIAVDVADYVRTPKTRRRLSSFTEELAPRREQFLSYYQDKLTVETNCIELLHSTWEREHNSFFDALNTYLLWSGRIWRKKLV